MTTLKLNTLRENKNEVFLMNHRITNKYYWNNVRRFR